MTNTSDLIARLTKGLSEHSSRALIRITRDDARVLLALLTPPRPWTGKQIHGLHDAALADATETFERVPWSTLTSTKRAAYNAVADAINVSHNAALAEVREENRKLREQVDDLLIASA